MSELPFDVHEHRHRLKQLKDTGEKSLWKNEDGLACPICDEPFAYLVTMAYPTTFASESAGRTCIAHQTASSPVTIFMHS